MRVTLLDSSPFLYYSGMVPEFLGGVYDRDEVRINLRRLCDRAGVRFIESRAQQLDPERRVVTTADGDPLSYDVAAVDIGAQNPPRRQCREPQCGPRWSGVAWRGR
mgnify:CR=1 FL=1